MSPATPAAPPTDPGEHFFPLTGKKPCPDCGQPEGVKLHVGATGYSVTSGFNHTPECLANFCEHGVRWSADCKICDSRFESEEGED